MEAGTFQLTTRSNMTGENVTSNIADAAMLARAYEAATRSLDPSTQNGAVLSSINSANGFEQSILSIGHNRMPRGVASTDYRLTRPQKYGFIVHAEVATVMQALRMASNSRSSHRLDTLFVVWFACSDCAKVIIEANVHRVVGHRAAQDFALDHGQPHWRDSVAIGLEMLAEAGVICEWYDGPVDAQPIRIAETMFDPRLIGPDTPQ